MPISDLPVTTIEVKTATIDFKLPQVMGPTALITADINQRIAESAQLRAMYVNPSNALRKGSVTCEIGVATTVLVSWACTNDIEQAPSFSAGAPPTGRFGRTIAIDKGKIKEVGLEDLLTDFETLKCITKDDAVLVQSDGLETNGTWNGNGGNPSPDICTVPYADMKDHLGPELTAVASAKRGNAKIVWPAKSDRFVVSGEIVHDNLTNLDWATHDNGADLDLAAAEAFATAAKLDGKSDWRLPRENEMESLLSFVGAAHKEPKDCTKGKSQLLIVSEIHPSCGIMWTSDAIEDGRSITVGLISGGARVQSAKAKTNARALIVRTHGS